jgi:hypothetical protein
MPARAQPNKFTNFFRSLEKASPYEISNQWFHSQTFFLDGYSFKNCRFDNCKLFLNRNAMRSPAESAVHSGAARIGAGEFARSPISEGNTPPLRGSILRGN